MRQLRCRIGRCTELHQDKRRNDSEKQPGVKTCPHSAAPIVDPVFEPTDQPARGRANSVMVPGSCRDVFSLFFLAMSQCTWNYFFVESWFHDQDRC